jgi:hypothetical protein
MLTFVTYEDEKVIFLVMFRFMYVFSNIVHMKER